MTLAELNQKLNALGLNLTWDGRRSILIVGNPAFANPLLMLNPYLPREEYTGTLSVKSINIALFTETQIKHAIMYVDHFLSTDLEKRDLKKKEG